MSANYYLLLLFCFCISCKESTTTNADSIPITIETNSNSETVSLSTKAQIEKQNYQLSYSDFLSDELSFQFDYPIGDKNGKGSYIDKSTGKTHNGWYIATETGEHYSVGIHTGEDWNGNGGSNTDLDQPVYAISNGKVIHAKDEMGSWGNTIIIEHVYIRNGQLDTIFSLYAHLEAMDVEKGQLVTNRQLIGSIGDAHGVHLAHLHLEIRKKSMRTKSATYWPSSNGKDKNWVLENYFDPSTFIDCYRKIENPKDLDPLLIAVKQDYKMYYLKHGILAKTYEIALSQNGIGHKQVQGDLKLPEGNYKIIQKSRGPFEGSYGDFFGSGWMRLNYPNNYDGEMAQAAGKISRNQLNAIKRANKNGKEPPRNTGLGAGIGIHGWSGDWNLNGGRNLTWGCISMLNDDLDKLYDELPLGTDIYINP